MSQEEKLRAELRDSFANRAILYYEQGAPERALADFESVLKLDPDNTQARKGRDFIVGLQSQGSQ